MLELTLETVRPMLPERPDAGHKGTFGHVFIVAGSRGFTGAAKLACEAACRSGAGLVTAGIPTPLRDLMGAALLEAMTLCLPSTEAETLSLAALEPALAFSKDKQAVVLGPGLSTHPETVAFVRAFVAHGPVPLVVDADALNALAKSAGGLVKIACPCVLTPHPGEMARLTGASTAEVQADRTGTARDLANALGCTVILKGARTVVADADGALTVNTTGNHGLAKGGTGDVLAGLLGGLLAQGLAPFDAACLAVFVHGRAGDFAADRSSARGMLARDVIEAIPAVWRELEEAGA